MNYRWAERCYFAFVVSGSEIFDQERDKLNHKNQLKATTSPPHAYRS